MTSSTVMPAGPEDLLGQRLRVLLGAERAVEDLRRYFGIGLQPGQVPYTGSRFELAAGGGARPSVADRITAEDLIAVQTLSVTVPVSGLYGHRQCR